LVEREHDYATCRCPNGTSRCVDEVNSPAGSIFLYFKAEHVFSKSADAERCVSSRVQIRVPNKCREHQRRSDLVIVLGGWALMCHAKVNKHHSSI